AVAGRLLADEAAEPDEPLAHRRVAAIEPRGERLAIEDLVVDGLAHERRVVGWPIVIRLPGLAEPGDLIRTEHDPRARRRLVARPPGTPSGEERAEAEEMDERRREQPAHRVSVPPGRTRRPRSSRAASPTCGRGRSRARPSPCDPSDRARTRRAAPSGRRASRRASP